MATHSSILAWRIPTEEPGRLQFIGLHMTEATQHNQKSNKLMFFLLQNLSAGKIIEVMVSCLMSNENAMSILNIIIMCMCAQMCPAHCERKN